MRYQLRYKDENDEALAEKFPTSTHLIESFSERSPRELAESITIIDLSMFRCLSLQNIMDNDENYRRVGGAWDEWSLAVQEGAIIGQDFARKALEVAKAS